MEYVMNDVHLSQLIKKHWACIMHLSQLGIDRDPCKKTTKIITL